MRITTPTTNNLRQRLFHFFAPLKKNPKTTTTTTPNFSTIPDDILLRIITHLDPHDICALSCVNRFWSCLLKCEEYWKHVTPSWCIDDDTRREIIRSGKAGLKVGDGCNVWKVFERGCLRDTRELIGLWMRGEDAEKLDVGCVKDGGDGDMWVEGLGRRFVLWGLFREVKCGGFYTVSCWLEFEKGGLLRAGNMIVVDIVVFVGRFDERGTIVGELRVCEEPQCLIRPGVLVERKMRIDCFNVPVMVEGDSVAVGVRGVDCRFGELPLRVMGFEVVPAMSKEEGDIRYECLYDRRPKRRSRFLKRRKL